MKKADIGVGIGLLILSVWIFWNSQAYLETVIYIYGPNLFPQLISIILGICSITLIIQAMRGRALRQTDHINGPGFIRMVSAIGMCIGYLFLMQLIGFAFATIAFLFALMTFLGQQGIGRRILSSVAVSLIVWAIFRYLLVIPVPSGMLPMTF